MDIRISPNADAQNLIAGDILLENGDIRLTKNLAEEVQQDLLISLRLFQGEWFLDPSQGIPYFQSIIGKKVPLSIVTQVFRSAILQRPGIASLDSINVTPLPNRSAQLIFQVTLADGTILKSSDFAPLIIGGVG